MNLVASRSAGTLSYKKADSLRIFSFVSQPKVHSSAPVKLKKNCQSFCSVGLVAEFILQSLRLLFLLFGVEVGILFFSCIWRFTKKVSCVVGHGIQGKGVCPPYLGCDVRRSKTYLIYSTESRSKKDKRDKRRASVGEIIWSRYAGKTGAHRRLCERKKFDYCKGQRAVLACRSLRISVGKRRSICCVCGIRLE